MELFTADENKVMVRLLTEIERNPHFTQRSMASELGIALGLINCYLKRCVTKGLIRTTQVSPRRLKYFITPEGFAEKSLMVKNYLARSFMFFRDARSQCEEAFLLCRAKDWKKIALVGPGDLCDIAQLIASTTGVLVKVMTIEDSFANVDAILITDIENPQGVYDALSERMRAVPLIALPLLHISKSTVCGAYKAIA